MINFENSSDFDHNHTLNTIYLAGGCFWGVEKLFKLLPGVVKTVCGYANGDANSIPDYNKVCTGKTGHRETVKVVFDPAKINIDALLFAFFCVIDPTLKNRQGNDVGTQYQTGIYFTDEFSKEAIERVVSIEKENVTEFYVEVEPLKCFFDAEEYHQNYLDKNPLGYCHLNPGRLKKIGAFDFEQLDYNRSAKQILKEREENKS